MGIQNSVKLSEPVGNWKFKSKIMFNCQSLLVLFRCCTGEVWQEIMMSCIKSPDVQCDPMRWVCDYQDDGDGDDYENDGDDIHFIYLILQS